MLCRICEEKKAVKRHIETHGISYEDYLKKYEPEKYYQKRVIEKLNDLYITTRYKFVEVKGDQTYTVTKEKRRFGLSDKDLLEHIEGKKSIAVHSTKDKSKFISFDIDTQDLSVLESVYKAIGRFVDPKYLLISKSGNKGFHIDLSFTELIPHTVLNNFYQLILLEADSTSDVVECRGNSQQALKLPFTFHQKTGNYCGLCNEYGQEIYSEYEDYEAFLKLEKIDSSLIYDVLEINKQVDYFNDEEIIEKEELEADTRLLPIYQRTLEDKVTDVLSLIQNGIEHLGQRHEATFQIAVYLKNEGYDKDKTIESLQKWTKDKVSKRLYNSTWNEVLQDIKDTVNSVYRNDYKLMVKQKEIVISRLEMKEILSVKKAHLRKLYFIFFNHHKAFADSQGVFYLTYEQMSEAGAVKNDRPQLKRHIDELVELGKVQVVRRGERAEGQMKHLPNKYKLLAFEPETTVTIQEKIFTPCRKLSKDCVNCTACHLLGKKDLKEIYGRNAEKISKLKRVCKREK